MYERLCVPQSSPGRGSRICTCTLRPPSPYPRGRDDQAVQGAGYSFFGAPATLFQLANPFSINPALRIICSWAPANLRAGPGQGKMPHPAGTAAASGAAADACAEDGGGAVAPNVFRGIFAKDLRVMQYGYGDDESPLQETVGVGREGAALLQEKEKG